MEEAMTQGPAVANGCHSLSALKAEIDYLAAENAKLRRCANGFRARHNVVAKAYTEVFAERGELRRRLDAIVEMLAPGEQPKEPCPSATSYEHQLASFRRKLWLQHDRFYCRAVAIAKGER